MSHLQKILTLLFCLISGFAYHANGQADTTIDNNKYRIIERYDNGKTKAIGQFSNEGSDDGSLTKHGDFFWFDENGDKTKHKLYFFGQRRNKRFLGLKQGWWGWYGLTTKYFLGIRVTKPVIVDPSF